MTYRTTLVGLADLSGATVAALWSLWEAGRIDRAEFVARAAVVVATANARAATLADLSLAAAISVQLGQVIPAIGITPIDDMDRIRDAASTVAELGTVGRAVRLARAEPLEAAARAYSAGIAESPHVVGWRRQTSSDACPLCTGWARAGALPDSVAMRTHKGCSCIPVPVTEGA